MTIGNREFKCDKTWWRNKSKCHVSCDLDNKKASALQRSERSVFYIDLAESWNVLG